MTRTFHPKELRAFELLEVPPPRQNPEEIRQQLMAFRNEWHLYRRTCDATGKTILSAYRSDAAFPVYRNDFWWGDGWDGLAYGRPFDFNRPFFEQFHDLLQVVPREGTSVYSSENCDYNSHIRESKNCYMNSLIYRCEDTHYSYWGVNNKDVVDCLMVNNSSLAYECLDCQQIYDCAGLQDCSNCTDCCFSFQLRGCSNCIGCADLVNKSFCILNEQVSKDRFEKEKARLLNGSASGWQEGENLFSQAYAAARHRAVHNLNCENAVGDHLINCRNCWMSFDGHESEDVFYTVSMGTSKDIYYCYSAGWPTCEWVYNSAVTRGSNNIAFCYYTYFSSNLRYCDSLMSCRDCFGCTGLKHRQYCILNRQYSQADYENLRSRIIEHMKNTGEWGSYFPIKYSTFAYNETCAQDYHPLAKDEVSARGWLWRDLPKSYEHTGPVYHLPDSRQAASADMTKEVLACKTTGKNYRLVKQELSFYEKLNLPLPKECPAARHARRLNQRNPLRLEQRSCAVTGEKVYSSYPVSRCSRVFSDKAYLEALG